MTRREQQCVYVARSPGEADVVANWLNHQGIETRVMDRTNLGGVDGLNFFAPQGAAARGIEVWVLDGKQLAQARQLVAEHQARKPPGERESESAPLTATCEDCSKASSFPAWQAGSVQNCPHCRAYMDVPGGNDEFEWPDETTA